MATIDISPLQNWPSKQSVAQGGQDIGKAGKDFQSDLTTAKTDWNSLNNKDVYDTPSATTLFQSLDCLKGMGEHVQQGTALAGAALEVFSAWLDVNESTRSDLEKACEEFNKTSEPPSTVPAKPGQPSSSPSGTSAPTSTNPDYSAYMSLYQDLKDQVDELKSQFEKAVDDCVTGLDSITSDGTSVNKLLNSIVTTIDTSELTGAQIALVGAYRQTTTSITRYTVRLAGHDFKIPLLRSKDVSVDYKFSDLVNDDKFLERLKANLKDPFAVAGPKTPDAPGPKVSSSPAEGKWGIGEDTTTTVTNSSKALKIGGRALFVVGAAVTIGTEYNNRYDEVSTEHPEYSESQKQSAATEAGVVRGGSQILAAAGAGALIGSAVPVGGTAVGAVVGVCVGLAMAIPTGDGKSVGDRIADGGEWLWKHTGASDVWHSIWH